MTKRLHITVRGLVQGVCFRAEAVEQARALGLRGYVRNRADGAVEVVAEGEPGALDRLVDWARRGPPAARVEEIDVAPAEPDGSFAGFEVRH